MRVDVPAGLIAHTRSGAEVLGRADRLGSIAPGKFADFAVLEADPTELPAESVPDVKVVQTWIAGQRVWAND